MPEIKKVYNFHTLGVRETLEILKTSRAGLSLPEAEHRLAHFGVNQIPEEEKYSRSQLFLSQFNNPLIYILILAIFISCIFRNFTDAIFIIIVVLINAILGFVQEDKVAKALLFLKKAVQIYVKALRDSGEIMLSSIQLVPGDIIIMRAGDKVPADARLIEARELEVNEAALTGESFPVVKTLAPLPYTEIVAKQTNMIFAGTLIERGRAVAVITSTGDDTEFGRIAKELKGAQETPTPLQKKFSRFTRWLSMVILLVAGILFAIGYIKGQSFADLFVSSLAFAVSAIPAGLPPLITVILVLGVRNLLRHKTLVKKLNVVEALGSTNVICTDKTGTLTSGEMRVSHILTGASNIGFGNKKFNKKFGLRSPDSSVTVLKIVLGIADVFIEHDKLQPGKKIIHGRSTDKALVEAAYKVGLEKDVLDKEFPCLTDLPFDSRLKFSASLRQESPNSAILFVVGAPEAIVQRIISVDINGRQKMLPSKEFSLIQKNSDVLAKKGSRILACAYGRYDLDKARKKPISELLYDLTFAGFIALKDCVRKEAKEALRLTRAAGIKTIIITGDQLSTAKAIAREIGLSIKDAQVLEGEKLENISDQALQKLVKKILIYFRVSPHHKIRIIEALQVNGGVTAMIGDGVNDAPAIKAADIGVALGSGTDIAKEASDMVLTDDNFYTIAKAVELGRMIFENIRRTIIYFVADDFSEVFVFLCAILAGMPLPLIPVQILWIDMIENAFPAVALAFSQESFGVMKDKPRGQKEPIFNKAYKKWLLTVFLAGGAELFLTYFLFLKLTNDIALTRTVVFVLTMIDSLCFMMIVSALRRPLIRKDLFSNRYLALALLIGAIMIVSAVYLPVLNEALSTVALSPIIWGLILAISVPEIILLEITKYWFLGRKKVRK